MKLRQESWAAVNKVGQEWAEAKRQLSQVTPDSPQYSRLRAYAENMEQMARNTIVEKIMYDFPDSQSDRNNEELDYAIQILERLIIERLPKFDGKGGNLSQYTNMCIGYLMKDHPYSRRHDLEYGKGRGTKNRTDDSIDPKYMKPLSLDEQINPEDDESETRGSQICDPKNGDLGAEIFADELLFALITNIMNMKTGKKAQERYNSMLFTDTMVTYIRNYAGGVRASQHEQELFKALEITFLDFFMADPCRTVAQIENGSTELYSHLVDDQPDTPCPLPLEAKVFIAYLAKVKEHPITPSAWSQARKKYQDIMRELL